MVVKKNLKKSKGVKATQPYKLFWASTEDHDEDWFIVAHTAAAAARLHEDLEGYGHKDAEAEFVCEVPSSCQNFVAGWPSDALIAACGGKFLAPEDDDPQHEEMRKMIGQGNRAVLLGNRIFVEGDMVRSITARQAKELRVASKFDCYFCDVLRELEVRATHEHEDGEICRECMSGLALDTFMGGIAAANTRMPVAPGPAVHNVRCLSVTSTARF